MARVFIQMNYSILKQTYGGTFDTDNPVSHDGRSRIQSEDNLFFNHFSHGHKIGRLRK